MTDAPVSNAVLVTVDSLHSDDIAPYGGEYDTSTLSSLTERGTVFENAFAHGNWTPILATCPVFADTGRIGVDGEDVTQQPIPRSLDEGDLLISARDAGWVSIRNIETGAEELYDRQAAPDQRTDRSTDDDPPAAAAREHLRTLVEDRASMLVSVDVRDEGVDEDLETRLDALGYR